MSRRAVAAYLGAALCLTWAVLVAVSFLRRRAVDEPDDVQPVDPYPFGLSGSATRGPSVTVTMPGQTHTYTSGGGSSVEWREAIRH